MKSVRKMITLAAAVSLAVVLTCGASMAVEPNKEIRVEAKQEKIVLDVKPGKKSYAVDEPISFKLKVNKPVYVYIFNVSNDGDKVTMLFPNKFDTNNKVKPAKKGVTIPGKSDFKSDSEGSENIVVLASIKELSLDAKPLENSKFLSVQKGTFDKVLKAIRVEPSSNAADENGAIKELKVTIKEKK